MPRDKGVRSRWPALVLGVLMIAGLVLAPWALRAYQRFSYENRGNKELLRLLTGGAPTQLDASARELVPLPADAKLIGFTDLGSQGVIDAVASMELPGNLASVSSDYRASMEADGWSFDEADQQTSTMRFSRSDRLLGADVRFSSFSGTVVVTVHVR